MVSRYEEFPFQALQKLIDSRNTIKQQVMTSVITDSVFMDRYAEDYQKQLLIRQGIDSNTSVENNISIQMKEMMKKLYPNISTPGDKVIFDGLLNILNTLDSPSNIYQRLKIALTAVGLIDSQVFQQVIDELNTSTSYENLLQKINLVSKALDRESTINVQNTVFNKLTEEQIMIRLQELEDELKLEIINSSRTTSAKITKVNNEVLGQLQSIIESQLSKEEIAIQLFELIESAKDSGASKAVIEKLEKAIDIRKRLNRSVINLSLVQNSSPKGPLDLILIKNDGYINDQRIHLEDFFKGDLKYQDAKAGKKGPSVLKGDKKVKLELIKLLAYSIEDLDLSEFSTYSLTLFKKLAENGLMSDVLITDLENVPKYKTIQDEIIRRQNGEGVIIRNDKSNDKLVKRMNVLIGSHKAGNKNNKLLKNELSGIIDQLLKDKIISPSEHKTIFKNYIQ